MTSLPASGIQDSLQHRAAGGGRGRPPSRAPHVAQEEHVGLEDPAVKLREPASLKTKPVPLDSIQTSGDAFRLPPRGMPQLLFNTVASNAPLHSPYGQLMNAGTPLPVPPRPGSSFPVDSHAASRIIPGGTGVKGDAALIIPGNDAPAVAVMFPGRKTADFFPWTGNNSEDMLSETLVKGGISNKPQIMNETNTARPSLWSNLKNKTGTNMLSKLFVEVLEKRQSCGRLTAPNSFKPPPRLTLRDSTRETWLHDLANPTANLRRLSRTIPHGVTGVVLLEQCLNKHIPLPRAVWLAKCVGINEMRSHKRKGQAGTITWIRAWTGSVEQFLDSTIAMLGQPDWKPRITYALQLATSLYREHLLEDDHFLDWILRCLESCASERLFLWLLVGSLYAADLTASRRRGKQFAESLLYHADKLFDNEEDGQTSPILEYIEKLLMKLLVSCPSSLLLPRNWDKHRAILQRLAFKHPHPLVVHAVESLERRNFRIMHSPTTNSGNPQNPVKRAMGLLDAVDFNVGVRIEKLANDCMDLISDGRELISTVLRWASSVYRDGLHRVYLATRLLRKWSCFGADIDDGVLSYLCSTDRHLEDELCYIFRIVSELVRSKTFSVGKYLQWLIATGSLPHSLNISSPSAWRLRLMTELPLSGLSEQVRNLRSTLLRSTSYTTDAEERNLDQAEDTIRRQLPRLFGGDSYEELPVESAVAGLSGTIKHELAMILRQQVARNVQIFEHVPTKDPAVDETGPVCMIAPDEFHVVRSYLEECGDLAILADVIGVAATSLNGTVLASVADTLHYNHYAFCAIGAFEPLFGKIAMRYAAIRTTRFPERDLLLSLTDLSRTARAEGHLMQALAYDLSRHDQKNSLAACSPVSDTMTETIHSMATDTEGEIDRILSSGTSMDHQIMMRVFSKVLVNLEEQTNKGTKPSGYHTVWFYRLRSFDENAFDVILKDWLQSMLLNHRTKLCHAAFPPLVASGCMKVVQFLETARACVARQRDNNRDAAFWVCMDALDVLLPSGHLSALCPPQEAYKFRMEQRQCCYNPDGFIIRLVAEAYELGTAALSPTVISRKSSLLSSARLHSVVRHFVVRDMQLISTAFEVGLTRSSEQDLSLFKSLFETLLDPTEHWGFARKTLKEQVSLVVKLADDLSLPFCQLVLRQLFAASSRSPGGSGDDTVSEALLEAVKAAVDRGQLPWADLVAGLDHDLANKIRDHAIRELLDISAFLARPSEMQLVHSDQEMEAFIQKYLTVIDFTSSRSETIPSPAVLAALVERFKGIGEAISRTSEASAEPLGLSPAMCRLWLNALLRLSLVDGSSSLGKSPHQHQAALLWSLRSLLTHPAFEAYPSVSEFIFDVAAILSDSIADDVRNHLMRLNSSRPTMDSRCGFLFGMMPEHDGWLALARPVIAPPAPITPAVSSPHSQSSQNSAGYFQQHQGQGQGASPGAPFLQRPHSQQNLQAQAQNQNRMYPQYPQHPQHPQHSQQNRMLAQLQRMSSSNGQLSQLQQMQQMQQRSAQPSPASMQRQPAPPPQNGGPNKARAPKPEEQEMKTVPFALQRWEVLPESSGNAAGNETAISLTLFGARKV